MVKPTTDLMPLGDALAYIAANIKPLAGVEIRALDDCLNAVAAADITASYPLPPFDNTAVDGYAFRHVDVAGQQLAKLRVVGESMAGEPYTQPLPEGCAVRIATGGMLPGDCDTVAMQEHCERDGDMLIIATLPPLKANIRRQGNDIATGAIAIGHGHRLRPQEIALAGALGLTEIKVRRRLQVAIASTGQELREAGAKLSAGQIIDTNSLMLKQLLARHDAAVTILPSLPDDYDATVQSLTAAATIYDLVITSGGVSVGKRDFVRDTLHDHGKVLFWKLAIKPGKPVLLGQIGDCLMAGLPGNPVSAMVTFFLIINPLLQALTGQSSFSQPTYKVPLAAAFKKEMHLRVFPRARLVERDGVWQAEPYGDQSSNLINSLAQADGLLDLPLGRDAFTAGEMVAFRPFSGLFG